MADQAELFIQGGYHLAEGPIWHRERQALFWFDILANTLFAADAGGKVLEKWEFDVPVAAAAIIDSDNLAIASAGALLRLDIETGERVPIIALEADKPGNRPNDSRVDRRGGFWIGTMGRKAEAGAGSVYHFRQGVMTKLLGDLTIPNSTCFSPDGDRAYFTDTLTGHILTCNLDPDTGLPASKWELFVDCNDQRGSPDGAIVDAAGYLWSARWGGSCVVRHAPDGSIDRTIEVPTKQVTCPALGGPGLQTLFITTARENLSDAEIAADPLAGSLFAVEVDTPGQAEVPLVL